MSHFVMTGNGMTRFKYCFALGLIFLLTSCNSLFNQDEKDDSPFKDVPEKTLYAEAKEAMKKGQYTNAIKRYEAMESLYPFSDNAQAAELSLIHAYYQNEDYALATATADRFVHLYPRSSRVDYAYYMKGLANFQQNRGMFAKVLPLDEAWRDSGTQAQAFNDFSELVTRFPKSRYRADALQRMIYLRNMFAKRELHTAQYYFDRKMYVAAASRATYLIKTYPQAPSAHAAMKILAASQKIMGLKPAYQEIKKVHRVAHGAS